MCIQYNLKLPSRPTTIMHSHDTFTSFHEDTLIVLPGGVHIPTTSIDCAVVRTCQRTNNAHTGYLHGWMRCASFPQLELIGAPITGRCTYVSWCTLGRTIGYTWWRSHRQVNGIWSHDSRLLILSNRYPLPSIIYGYLPIFQLLAYAQLSNGAVQLFTQQKPAMSARSPRLL